MRLARFPELGSENASPLHGCSPCERSHPWLWMFQDWRDGTRAAVREREEYLSFSGKMRVTIERIGVFVQPYESATEHSP